MSDLITEIANRKTELWAKYPQAAPWFIEIKARFDAAYARGDYETADHFVPFLVELHLAAQPWWRWLIKPKLWLVWLCLRTSGGAQ
jgi:hypothetical protein